MLKGEEPRVFGEVPFEVRQIEWQVSSVRRVYARPEGKSHWKYLYDAPCVGEPASGDVGGIEVVGYTMGPGLEPDIARLHGESVSEPAVWLTGKDLPTEFFNHQVMDCDTESESSVYDFVRMWGFPYSPWRGKEGDFPKRKDVDARAYEAGRGHSEAVGATRELFEDFKQSGLHMKQLPDRGGTAGNPFHVISLAEARFTIRSIQEAVRDLWRCLRACCGADGADVVRDDQKPWLEAIRAGARNPLNFRPYTPMWDKVKLDELSEWGNLTSAICNQLIATGALEDEPAWHECACEGCEVVFRQKQDYNSRTGKRSAPQSKRLAQCCCRKCEERQRQRRYRAEKAKRRSGNAE